MSIILIFMRTDKKDFNAPGTKVKEDYVPGGYYS